MYNRKVVSYFSSGWWPPRHGAACVCTVLVAHLVARVGKCAALIDARNPSLCPNVVLFELGKGCAGFCSSDNFEVVRHAKIAVLFFLSRREAFFGLRLSNVLFA